MVRRRHRRLLRLRRRCARRRPRPCPAISAALPPPAVPPTPTPTPAPAAPSKAVVEFADEVVEVRRAAPAAPSASAAKPAGDGKPLVTAGSRVLQFHKQESGGGLLGDDLGQLSGGTRTLLFVGVLVVLPASSGW